MPVCGHCGCDRFDTTLKERYWTSAMRLEKEYKRAIAEFAVKEAQWRLEEFNRIDDRKGLQRKVVEQRRTINRLENKLRKHGATPYAEDSEEMGD